MKLFHVGLCVEANENGFQKALKKVSTEYREIHPGVTSFNIDVLKIAEEFRPDIIFMQIQSPGILHLDTARKLAEIGFVINWTGDVRHEVPAWMREIGEVIQLTTFSNMTDVERCAGTKVKADYLEIGFDPEKYKVHGIIHACPEIVFFGNNYGDHAFELSKERREMALALKTYFRERFGVYGTGWAGLETGNFMGDQVRESQQYNNCKIAINHSHFNYKRYSSDRLLRILGSGTFCLSHHYDGIELDYKHGKHLETYRTTQELINQCEYWLDSKMDEARQTIAWNGYEHVRKNFTFLNQAEEIVKLYEKHNGK